MTKETDLEEEKKIADREAREANAAAIQAQIDELIKGNKPKPHEGKQSLRDFIADKMAEDERPES